MFEIIDDGCPTCGSKKYALLKIANNSDNGIEFLQCQNCKKSWTS